MQNYGKINAFSLITIYLLAFLIEMTTLKDEMPNIEEKKTLDLPKRSHTKKKVF